MMSDVPFQGINISHQTGFSRKIIDSNMPAGWGYVSFLGVQRNLPRNLQQDPLFTDPEKT